MQLPSLKVLGRSVAISMATMSTAFSCRLCFLTNSSLHSTAAALPSDVGLYVGVNTMHDYNVYNNYDQHIYK